MSKILSNPKRVLVFSCVAVLVLILDQWSKVWARTTLGMERIGFWNNFFVLEHSENPGAFLGMGAEAGANLRFSVFTVGVGVVVIGSLIYLFRKKNLTRNGVIAYSLFISGGVGNLIDRLIKGTVTDFMNMGIGSLRTGIFNIADMAIMVAVAILLFTQAEE